MNAGTFFPELFFFTLKGRIPEEDPSIPAFQPSPNFKKLSLTFSVPFFFRFGIFTWPLFLVSFSITFHRESGLLMT